MLNRRFLRTAIIVAAMTAATACGGADTSPAQPDTATPTTAPTSVVPTTPAQSPPPTADPTAGPTTEPTTDPVTATVVLHTVTLSGVPVPSVPAHMASAC